MAQHVEEPIDGRYARQTNHRRLIKQFLRSRWFVQVAVAIVLLGLVASHLDANALARSFAEVQVAYLPLALLVYVGSRVVNAWEWRLLLIKVGQAPLSGLFGILLIGTLVNAVLPANMGDVAKIQIAANRYSLPRIGVVAGRGAEAVVNSVIFVFFVALSVALVPTASSYGVLWLLAAASTALSAVAIIGSRMMKAEPPKQLNRVLPHRLRPAVDEHWPRFYDGLEVIRRPKLLAGLLLLNLFGWVVDILITWSYGSAFDLNLPLSAYVSITVVLAVITTFPITFGNIGSWEFGIVALLALYEVPAERALAYAVGSHFFITFVNIGLGLVAMALLNLRPREVFSFSKA